MRLRLFHHKNHASCEVILSRRKLVALLAKLELEGSARTLVSDNCPAGLSLVVRAEDDDEHYAGRAEPPGPMHPHTEVFIRSRDEEAETSADSDRLADPEGQEFTDATLQADLGRQVDGAAQVARAGRSVRASLLR